MDIKDIEKKTKKLDDKAKEFDLKMLEVEKKSKDLEDAKEALISMSGFHTKPRSDSDESRALRFFGVPHVKDLLHVNTEDMRYRHVPAELKGLVRDLKRDIDVSRMTQQICFGESVDRAGHGSNGEIFSHVKGVLDGNYYGKHVLAPKLKAFGSTVPGAGDEWVPTAVSSQYIEEFELERQVVGQFRQINMPSNPFDMPVQDGVTVARIQSEGGTIAGTNFGTGKVTLDATKLTEFMVLPEELNEDSAPQILSLSRLEVVEAQARAYETAILNGDTAVTHQDNDVTAAEDARKAVDGLRKLALANSANGATVDFLAAVVSTAKLRSMRTAMGKFGVNVRDLAWLVSSKVYNQFLDLAEVTTVDKMGAMATILKGALSALDGIPIVITEYQRDDVAATGVNTLAGPNTTSLVTLVNHKRFYWGVRRPIRVRAVMDPTPPQDRWMLASWSRVDFKGHAQSANEVSVVLGYNVL